MKFIKKGCYYFSKVYKSIEYTSDLSREKFLLAYKIGIIMIA